MIKINSSVVRASLVAFVLAWVNLLSNELIVQVLLEWANYFLAHSTLFEPFLKDDIYQALLVFLPLLVIFLRITNVKYRPPIEKVHKTR